MNFISGDPTFWSEVGISKGAILQGIWMTVAISFAAIFIGTIIGIFIGLALTYGNIAARILARLYTDFVRGIPVLVLILALYYIVPLIGINLNAIQAGIASLAVFSGAHVAEMVRGALQSIHKGQTEAAQALGLNFSQTFIFVLMPQALRQILPTWINTSVEIVKGSSLISIIGVVEVTYALQQTMARNYMFMKFYGLAALIYFIIGYSLERLGKFVERKLTIK